MGLVKGIHHISMKCCDASEYNRVCEFYGGILGMDIIRTWNNGLMFDTGDGVIEVFTDGEKEFLPGTNRHLTLATDNVDECVKKVLKAGYDVFVRPVNVKLDSNSLRSVRLASCYGPLGEEIQFLQENLMQKRMVQRWITA